MWAVWAVNENYCSVRRIRLWKYDRPASFINIFLLIYIGIQSDPIEFQIRCLSLMLRIYFSRIQFRIDVAGSIKGDTAPLFARFNLLVYRVSLYNLVFRTYALDRVTQWSNDATKVNRKWEKDCFFGLFFVRCCCCCFSECGFYWFVNIFFLFRNNSGYERMADSIHI